MGTDIHVYAEQKKADGTWGRVELPEGEDLPRTYALFAWLANVRNYSGLPPLAMPKGVPSDMSLEVQEEYKFWDLDAGSPSWHSGAELLAFDYDAPVEDRRVTRQVGPNSFSGGCTADPGEGEMATYRQMFPDEFFEVLDVLRTLGESRLVFWFDS